MRQGRRAVSLTGRRAALVLVTGGVHHRRGDRGRGTPAPAGFRFQPIDASAVAARLAELTLEKPADLVPDPGGPRVYSLSDLLRGYLRATYRHRPIVPLRLQARPPVRSGPALTWHPSKP